MDVQFHSSRGVESLERVDLVDEILNGNEPACGSPPFWLKGGLHVQQEYVSCK
jgi:hypothetical protein